MYSSLEELLLAVVRTNNSNDPCDPCNPCDPCDPCKVTIVNPEQKGGGSKQIKAVVELVNGEKIRLFIKAREKGSETEHWDKIFLLFEREAFMYERVLPVLFQHQLQQSGSSTLSDVFAKYLGKGAVGGNEYLVFKDFYHEDYSLSTSDLHSNTQIEAALTQLGLFHAVGYSVKTKTPSMLPSLPLDRIYHPNFSPALGWALYVENIFILLKVLVSMVSQGNSTLMTRGFLQTDVPRELLNKLQAMAKESMDMMYKIQLPVEPMAMVTHGDFHMWNIAFKPVDQNGSGGLKVKFCDLQTSRYSSPLIDIHQYLCQVATNEQLDLHLERFLAVYLDSFTGALQELGSDGREFTKESIMAEYKRTAMFGFILSTRWLPPRYITDDISFNKAMDLAKSIEKKGEGEEKKDEEALLHLIDQSGKEAWWILDILCQNIVRANKMGILPDI